MKEYYAYKAFISLSLILPSPSHHFFHLPVTVSYISQSKFLPSPSQFSSISLSLFLPSPSHCFFHLLVTVSSISQSPLLPSQSLFLRDNLLFHDAIVLNGNDSEHNTINCSRPLQLRGIEDIAGVVDRHEILPILINIWIAWVCQERLRNHE